MGNRLDITKWEGKKQRLTTAIYNACKEDSYDELYLTGTQYLMLERTRELSMYPYQAYPPEGRIYMNYWGAMEIRLKRWYDPFMDTIKSIVSLLRSW